MWLSRIARWRANQRRAEHRKVPGVEHRFHKTRHLTVLGSPSLLLHEWHRIEVDLPRDVILIRRHFDDFHWFDAGDREGVRHNPRARFEYVQFWREPLEHRRQNV